MKDSMKLYDLLSDKVKGQDDAVQTLVDGYVQAKLFNKDRNRPAMSYLFMGPSGVGKTYLATCIADALEIPVLRLDMSAYATPHSSNGLIGFERTYRDTKCGVLTDYVYRNPTCCIILDEIEKAHEEVQRLFLQVLDGARLKDKYYDEEISFANTICIFTTNVGKELYEANESKVLSTLPQSALINALKQEKQFSPELISRFASGNLVIFNHLTSQHLAEIVKKQLNRVAENVKNTYRIQIEYGKWIEYVMLFCQDPFADARVISNRTKSLVENEIQKVFRRAAENSLSEEISRIDFCLQEEIEDGEVGELLVNPQPYRVLYISDRKNLQCINGEIDFFVTTTLDEMLSLISEYKMDMVLIDWNTVGKQCFKLLRNKAPGMIVYIKDSGKFDVETKKELLRMGAGGFLPDIESQKGISILKSELHQLYLQKKLELMKQKQKVLTYKTKQRWIREEKRCEIYYFDLALTDSGEIDSITRKNDKARLLSDVERPNVKFSDIIGVENAKAALKDFIDYVKSPEKYELRGSTVSKGVLLYGPPGTGKTMLAKATAGESEVAFLPVAASDFLREDSSEIHELFDTARRYAPSIVFIDEIDSIGKERTGRDTYTEMRLNTLLIEMDGFSQIKDKPVFVIASTNYDVDGTKSGKATKLDAALSRRFGNQIYVALPNQSERRQYLMCFLKKKFLDKKISEAQIKAVAVRSAGRSFADLQNIMEFALRRAVRSDVVLDDSFLEDAFQEYLYGERTYVDDEMMKMTAYHEAGHAFMGWYLGKIPAFMTIASRDYFFGYVHWKDGSKSQRTEEEILQSIRISLAGRAAEIVFFGSGKGVNTGAFSDLERATDKAVHMIRFLGAQKENRAMILDVFMNSEIGQQVYKEANQIVSRELEEAIKIIRKEEYVVKQLAEKVLKETQLSEEQIINLLERFSMQSEKKRQKYYAVKVGRVTGIYTSWNECEKQVCRYKGAKYRSFTTIEEAEEYLK